MWNQDPADVPDVRQLGEYHRVAQKQHKCAMCSKPIEVGQKYTHVAMTVDGKFESFNCHTTTGLCAYSEE